MRPVIGVQRKVCLSKTVLNDFLDLFTLAEEAPRDARHLTAVPLEELFERAFVPGSSSGHQHIVCRFGE